MFELGADTVDGFDQSFGNGKMYLQIAYLKSKVVVEKLFYHLRTSLKRTSSLSRINSPRLLIE